MLRRAQHDNDVLALFFCHPELGSGSLWVDSGIDPEFISGQGLK
jgi:hypothetical protein